MPDDCNKMKMLNFLQQYFYSKDREYSFEKFAADLTQYMDDSVVDINVTRPYKDGGLDAEGRYRIFKNAENTVYVEFYLQAKCYAPANGVVVSDTARLISRIKNRQFGIMFTTSYVAKQAYEEILKDGHPIVIINGKNIIEYIFNELEIRTISELEKWLTNNY